MSNYKYCKSCKETTPYIYNFEVQAWVCRLCGTKEEKKEKMTNETHDIIVFMIVVIAWIFVRIIGVFPK